MFSQDTSLYPYNATFLHLLRLLQYDEQVGEWHFHYAKASTSLVDRVGMLRNAADLVENNLTLLGATGIEDKLQVQLQDNLSPER